MISFLLLILSIQYSHLLSAYLCGCLTCQLISTGATQCLEPPSILSKKNCVLTGSKYGCTKSSDCCNPSAVCDSQKVCNFNHTCTYDYKSANPTSSPSLRPNHPSSQPIAKPSRRPIKPKSHPSCQPIKKPSSQPSTQPLRNPAR
eukprot:gene34578-46407_t